MLRRRALSPLLIVTCGLSFFLACSGGDEATPSQGGGQNSGKSGAAGKGVGGSGGLSGSSGQGGSIMIGGQSGQGSSAGSTQQQSLTVSPAAPVVTITAQGTPATQTFEALVDGKKVEAKWSLTSFANGAISATGTFTTSNLTATTTEVTATYGGKTAKAQVTIKVALSETVTQAEGDTGPTPANSAALDGPATPEAPNPDPAQPQPSKILYPYDGTVFPRGIVAPVLQFSPGLAPPQDAKVTLTSGGFSWSGKIKVQNPGAPQFSVPQTIWDAALLSAAGQKITIAITRATDGVAYGPATTSIIAATASLKGAVYYMSYHEPVGLYSVRPGVKEPAKQIVSGCVVCHSVSANGTHLSTGAETSDDAPDYPKSGVYKVGADGSATQLTQAPPTVGKNDQNQPQGDSRGLSHATWTPDGQYVMRARYNFWGGTDQQAWRVDDATAQLIPATVVGLTGVSALLPTVSPDGKRYAFTVGPGDMSMGTVSRAVDVMDLAVDAGKNTLSFTNRQTILDTGPGGVVTKFTAFLPDSNLMVLQEGEGYGPEYNEMLPSWDGKEYGKSNGRLSLLRLDTKEHLEMLRANTGNVDLDRQRNYEPFVLPVAAGGYYWVVFTSIREYGNTYQGGNARKQLWVTAIDTSSPAGSDPSHPAFFLPNQTPTANERGFWALEPCKASGQGCAAGDECCGGFCRPSDPADPQSAPVCKDSGDIPGNECSQASEKCASDADCCGATTGVRCINHSCTSPTPQIQ